MENKTKLVGLVKPWGNVAWENVKTPALKSGGEFLIGVFAQKIDELWKRFSPQNSLLSPPQEALQYIIAEVLPVMDKNCEAQCYVLLNAIRHFQSGYIPHDSSESRLLSEFREMGDMFSGWGKLALIKLKGLDEVKGTTLEKYLEYPLSFPRVTGRRTDLFSFVSS